MLIAGFSIQRPRCRKRIMSVGVAFLYRITSVTFYLPMRIKVTHYYNNAHPEIN